MLSKVTAGFVLNEPVEWRNRVNRAEKREFVTWLNEVFQRSGSIVVAHYSGLTVSQMNDLRTKMSEAGGSVKVVKNRLAKIALQGTKSEKMVKLFSGQTLIAYAEDSVVAPRILVDFAKTNEKLIVLGGAIGATDLDVKAVNFLASLLSLDALRAKIMGIISTPATRVAQVVNAPSAQVVRVIDAYARKGKAA